jgi:2',3'-cyclic-nucleotide 3'-phosphodiesterase
MPGASLWLLPPASHPLNAKLSTLIRRSKAHFASTHLFLPHITLTSDIDPAVYGADPQAWLDALHLPAAEHVVVRFTNLASEDVYVRKLYIACRKLDGLCELAAACRREVKGFDEEEKAQGWVKEKYAPHASLLYHDCAPIKADGLALVEEWAKEVGVELAGQGESEGWNGGRVLIVPTQRPIEEWVPLAERNI